MLIKSSEPRHAVGKQAFSPEHKSSYPLPALPLLPRRPNLSKLLQIHQHAQAEPQCISVINFGITLATIGAIPH